MLPPQGTTPLLPAPHSAQSFVDPSFNGHDWNGELKEHMLAAFAAPTGDVALGEIGAMIDDLGDPCTRRVPPE